MKLHFESLSRACIKAEELVSMGHAIMIYSDGGGGYWLEVVK